MTHTARALLDVPLAAAIAGVRRTVEAAGLTVDEGPAGAVVPMRSGTLRLSQAGARTALDIDAPEAAGLQLLRDLVAERIGEMGLNLDWQDRAGGRLPGNLSLARVESVARLSPSYTRVEISGPDLARFGRGGLHFRLLFGPEGANWPTTDENGVTRWPGGMAAWHRPVYTTRAIELLGGEAARITFDVFLHEGGRVTAWTESLRPGTEIAMTGPGGGGRPDASWMALIGDETAVPVIARILSEAPRGTRGLARLFVPEAADVQDLGQPEGVTVDWVLRGGQETPLDALHALALPDAEAFVFFAAERREAIAARDWLQARGRGRGTYHASAYWGPA